MASIGNGSESLDAHLVALTAIARFLHEEGYTSALEAFEREARQLAGWTPSSSAPIASDVDLRNLIEAHVAQRKQERVLAERKIKGSLLLANQILSPTELTLSGPATLSYSLTKTHAQLHPANILSLSVINLPTRSFSTAQAAYVVEHRKLLCSTAADKTIVFSDADSGEMVEVLEPASAPLANGGALASSNLTDTPPAASGHSAAALCTAQNPIETRELVSCGMDAKVILWDLLHRKPVQTLSHHTKFVVRCAYSPKGQYLATCSYDKTVRVYRRGVQLAVQRRTTAATSAVEEDAEEDQDEIEVPLLEPRYELVHTIETRNNPEALVFLRAGLAPALDDVGVKGKDRVLGERAEAAAMRNEEGANVATGMPSDGEQQEVAEEEAAPLQRTWLAYTMRSDSFVHYLALPLDADADAQDVEQETSDPHGEESLTESSKRLARLSVTSPATVTPDWEVMSFNTNLTAEDLHVSYSLLFLSLHPLGTHIGIQTGDHSIPTTGYAPASSSLSRILLLPVLSSKRTTTLWTGVSSSGFATNRHAWLKDGTAAWLTGEDGLLRLVDMMGKIRASVPAHGAAAEAYQRAFVPLPSSSSNVNGGDHGSNDEELRRTTSWSRGGNTIIKDVVVLDDRGDRIASCGFDRCIRIVARSSST